ncbi:MAG: hypothetical protein MJB57_03195 [Gemmatimonadetes bacterium]|nr:hypothetical protein [Gemmatimonadota bacterium]
MGIGYVRPAGGGSTGTDLDASRLTWPGFRTRILPRARLALVGALALWGAIWSPLAAQELDAGQLQWRADGRRTGVERFRVWRTGSTVNAVATIERVQGDERQIGLQLDADLVPTRYQFQEGSSLVEGTRFADRVRFHMVSDDGERWKEFPARAVQAVIEPDVAHHYLLLLQLLRERPDGLAIVIPSRGERALARLAGEGPDRVAVGEGSVSATRYDVEIGETRRSAWIDGEGKLLRVLDPGSGREALRLPARD